MTPSPTRKVLSTFRRRTVRALLMGGQACIVYGGAEFTRDIDFAVAVDLGNLEQIREALADLKAEQIYFPPLSRAVLRRGHACHFRCRARGVEGYRIDLMGRMRGAAPFETLWRRRTLFAVSGIGPVAVVSLPDLVRIKKTQRDKDWLMIRNVMDADIQRAGWKGNPKRVAFWLAEGRSFEVLRELSRRHPVRARSVSARRPALRAAMRGDAAAARRSLQREQEIERNLDRAYWAPLRAELERWRLQR